MGMLADRRSFHERLTGLFLKSKDRDKALGSRYRVTVMDVVDTSKQQRYFSGIRKRKRTYVAMVDNALEGRSPYEEYLDGFRPTGGC